MIYTTHSAKETKQIAADFAKKLKGGEFVALIGDLGSGKTTFVQGLAAALGSAAKVKSPTFTIMDIYPCKHPTIKQIVHVDFYRAPNSHTDLALDEYKTGDTIIVAEWPTPRDIKNRSHSISFALGKAENERLITIKR
ncbi:MAG: tRNA (adenosine(37)-N6)-threonylcarbamoyltransferase complex ATPase subunit type 1 TsaE [Patescibacteria group bacterium]